MFSCILTYFSNDKDASKTDGRFLPFLIIPAIILSLNCAGTIPNNLQSPIVSNPRSWVGNTIRSLVIEF